jgi:hypothetical protein
VKAPIELRTEAQLIKAPRDNLSTPNYWLLVGPSEVTLCQQRNGEESTGTLTIPRREFDRLARWYVTGKPNG